MFVEDESNTSGSSYFKVRKRKRNPNHGLYVPKPKTKQTKMFLLFFFLTGRSFS